MRHHLSLILILILITSCTKDNNQITNLTINLTHTVDNINLVIGGALLPYTNLAGEQYNVRRLQYIISNIKLNKVNEESILLKSIHFADLEDLTTLSIDMGELDNAEYTSITFTMGLENSNNITNTHLNENWHPTMAWPDIMGGGYHYMKLEGDVDTITKGYATHTGALQMMGEIIRMDHSFTIDMPINLTVDNNVGDVTININMEINNWYENPNIYNLSPAIMGDMSKQMQLQANGETDVFSVSVN